MTHAEILAKADAWRGGELPPGEKKAYGAHLKACPACRELLDKWPRVRPREGMTGRVMARLGPGTGRTGWKLGLAPLAAGLAAVLLILAAFWHPERRWLDEDKYFSRFDHGTGLTAVPRYKEGSYE